MIEAKVLWALWVFAGGHVNSGHLTQPYIAAYFVGQIECENVQRLVMETANTYSGEFNKSITSRCIQAPYVLNVKGK